MIGRERFVEECPLSGVNRATTTLAPMSASDPQQTKAG